MYDYEGVFDGSTPSRQNFYLKRGEMHKIKGNLFLESRH